MSSCEAHQFQAAIGICRSCDYAYCHECLVYPHGERKPPLCIPCALEVGGVRSTAGRKPRRSKGRRGFLADPAT